MSDLVERGETGEEASGRGDGLLDTIGWGWPSCINLHYVGEVKFCIYTCFFARYRRPVPFSNVDAETQHSSIPSLQQESQQQPPTATATPPVRFVPHDTFAATSPNESIARISVQNGEFVLPLRRLPSCATRPPLTRFCRRPAPLPKSPIGSRPATSRASSSARSARSATGSRARPAPSTLPRRAATTSTSATRARGRTARSSPASSRASRTSSPSLSSTGTSPRAAGASSRLTRSCPATMSCLTPSRATRRLRT